MNQTQKFALGGGSYGLYAPRFPAHQYQPGFCDEVLIFNARLPSLFSLAVLHEGAPVTLTCKGMKKENGCAVLEYTGEPHLKVVETRLITTDDRFVSLPLEEVAW